MAFFTPWKWLTWLYAGIVNDQIFAYNIIMLIAWFIFNVLNTASFVCIWSLYLELNDLTKLQDLARLKVGIESPPFLAMILISILNQAESITVLGQSRAPLPKQAPSVMSDHPMEAIPEERDLYEVRVVQILDFCCTV